ncbi:redoxin family protein [uncultured Phycicoccus sp.]|uniref:redoxin family protein n=1 Tax=uncultured Phycicoccus sp. TaxID=661422 RepID=UPI0026311185|nr:redoxin family protein [uncultured Phycicoccus sp.]
MRSTVLTRLVLGVALALSGCTAPAGDDPDPGPGALPAAPASLSFTAETLDGSTLDGRSLAGRPAVFWFWAPWCPTCRAQAGTVQAVSATYAGRVHVVGVGGLAPPADIRDYGSSVDGVTHLVDEDGSLWVHFAVTAQSTYVLLDADGRVAAQGYLDNEDLAARVAELVG